MGSSSNAIVPLVTHYNDCSHGLPEFSGSATCTPPLVFPAGLRALAPASPLKSCLKLKAPPRMGKVAVLPADLCGFDIDAAKEDLPASQLNMSLRDCQLCLTA